MKSRIIEWVEAPRSWLTVDPRDLMWSGPRTRPVVSAIWGTGVVIFLELAFGECVVADEVPGIALGSTSRGRVSAAPPRSETSLDDDGSTRVKLPFMDSSGPLS